MTSYIEITDGETDPGAPATSELAKKWRDNPIAMAEGAVGAPRIEFAAMAHGGVLGAVGTYALLSKDTGAQSITAGTTHAGSSLRYRGVKVGTADGNAVATTIEGGTPSGTWRAMGDAQNSSSTQFATTLFLRIA